MKKVILLLCLVGCMLLFSGCFPLLGMMLIGDAESEPLSEPEYSSSAEAEESSFEKSESEVSTSKYLVRSVSGMVDELENNALNAKDFYEGELVEVTGRVDTIDASGKYICLYSTDDEWAFTGVQCFIKNKDQKEWIKKISTGDIVTVRGEITMVGEVLGYLLDIHDFVEQES